MESSERSRVAELRRRLRAGCVIPAHPLALTASRKLDERRQRALSRYYLAAGAGGLAVGVHTTQFAIHSPEVGLYEPVLALGAEEARRFAAASGVRPILVAGVIGATDQAVREACLARDLGYDCGLLGLGALRNATEDELIAHVRSVAEELPIFGFYLQPAAGGRVLSHGFWSRFCEIERAVAIKIAAFDRYRTIDVVRAVAGSGRAEEISLYTGNDDNILLDLVTPFRFEAKRGATVVRFAGGLLGQWAVWTNRAVAHLAEAQRIASSGGPVPAEWLERNAQLTDANAAIFDPSHGFAGCIPGVHEILRRQGLLEGRWCIDAAEELSPGQDLEIDRVCRAYPDLQDVAFVEAHREEWLR
jgi:hypothetical protein